jgi:hypothetical protein
MLGLAAFFCLDYGLGMVLLTFRVDAAEFEAIGNGVAVKFPLPPQIDPKNAVGQYVYFNIPWIASSQWHAFSLMFDDASNKAGFYINSSGDFTQKLLLRSIELKERPIL